MKGAESRVDQPLTKEQLRERLNMRVSAAQFKRLPSMIREDQMERAKKYVEKMQASVVTSK
jgi:hypothetical protein